MSPSRSGARVGSGTASVYLMNQIEIGFTTPALHPHRNLDFTFVDFHLPTRDLVDPAWFQSALKRAAAHRAA
jgi:hypothetical protein